jgi:hypothetical protein
MVNMHIVPRDDLSADVTTEWPFTVMVIEDHAMLIFAVRVTSLRQWMSGRWDYPIAITVKEA